MHLSRILVGVASIGLLVSVLGGAWTTPMPGFADDLPASSTCSAELTYGSNDHFVELCEPATVTSQISPQCHRQRVHLLIIRPLASGERRWLPDSSIAILDALESDPRIVLAAGHLTYEGVFVGREYPVTEDLSLIRDTLSKHPNPAYNGAFHAGVVRRGIELLHEARLAADASPSPPIEILVLFSALKPGAIHQPEIYEPSIRESRIAATLVRGYAPSVLVTACSDTPGLGMCDAIRLIAPSGAAYAQPPDTRRLPRLILEELESRLAAGPAPASLTVEHRLPAGLTYLDGSASVPLTSSEPDLHAALDRIATAPQTRIHRGIEVAAAELASPRRAAGHTPVMVLLTDGRANPEGPEFAVAEADAAKRAGVTVFTVGLGDDLDHEALRAMASRPDDYHHAPDAEQLAEIYRAIAVAIPCPAERFWGRRP